MARDMSTFFWDELETDQERPSVRLEVQEATERWDACLPSPEYTGGVNGMGLNANFIDMGNSI